MVPKVSFIHLEEVLEVLESVEEAILENSHLEMEVLANLVPSEVLEVAEVVVLLKKNLEVPVQLQLEVARAL